LERRIGGKEGKNEGGKMVREERNGSISKELSGKSENNDGKYSVKKIKVGDGKNVIDEMKERKEKRK
jgi:hypothetical protein